MGCGCDVFFCLWLPERKSMPDTENESMPGTDK